MILRIFRSSGQGQLQGQVFARRQQYLAYTEETNWYLTELAVDTGPLPGPQEEVLNNIYFNNMKLKTKFL